MPLFYKGIGVGTHHHGANLFSSGLTARNPGGLGTINALMAHIARGTTTTPFISLTKSFGVAEMYAFASRTAPTRATPAYIWEIEIDDPPPLGVTVVDPVLEIAKILPSPLAHFSYQHDGDQNFLLGIVDPPNLGLSMHLHTRVREPPGQYGARTPNLSSELQALVRALRDAEVLVIGTIPQSCFRNRHDVC
jgi:hypothetical protein